MKKCKVWCCSNNSNDVSFEGEFCYFCYQTITEGKHYPNQTNFIAQLRDRCDSVDSGVKDIKTILESIYTRNSSWNQN